MTPAVHAEIRISMAIRAQVFFGVKAKSGCEIFLDLIPSSDRLPV